MLVFSYLLLVVSATRATADIWPRDAPGDLALNDFKRLDSDCESFYSTCQSANSTNEGGALSRLGTWEQDCNSTTTDIQKAAVYSPTNIQTFVTYLNSTFEPCLNKSLTCFRSRKPYYQKQGFATLVANDYRDFHNRVIDLGSALISKSPSSQQNAVKQVFTKMDADFSAGGGFS